MASNSPTVSYGSYGDTVRQLQEALNRVGYQLEVDGSYGKRTQAAVLDYQKKNNLRVDGVAGSETMGSLLSKLYGSSGGSSTSKGVLSGVSDETADRLAQLEQGYRPSDEVLAAQAEQESIAAMKPGDYQSGFDDELQALYDQIAGREDFYYDPNTDAAYQRYAALYTRQGRSAMEDTLGQAASLTGGYDSSYAQQAGAQSYNSYLQQLSALIPELEAASYDRYAREGQALEDQYQLVQQRKDEEYQQWLQGQEQWQQALEQAAERLETLRKEDREAYETMLKYYADKAAAEQKASDGRVVNSGKSAKTETTQTSLSSTASDSLQRAMNNYLKAEDASSALALAQQYAARMTPAQKKKITELFAKYGQTVQL